MRANPLIPLGMAACMLVLPGPVLALGLGKLTVQSSIGQPLSARIELGAATRDELDSMTVKIADPSLYRQNNLGYNSVLTRARITLERGATPYIRVVTQNPVNEPYLDLMVEVNWASGRLVRDYTFLLDPPGVLSTPVEPVAPVRVGAAPPRPAPVAAAPTAPGAAAPARTARPAPSDEYRVQRGDTLSEIASENKPAEVTLEQMLVALFRMNESAFDGDNINRLRAGSILKIPKADAAAATPAPEAAKIVRMQAAEWRTYRDRLAATAPASEVAAGRSAGGQIGGAVVETPPAAPPGRDQLKVSRDAGPGRQVGGVTEDMVARERQIKEAQMRIAELEKTLAELKRAVELKNETLAQLQAQAEATKGGPPAAVEAPKAPDVKLAEAPKTEPMKAAEPAAPAEPPKAAEAPPPPKAAAPAAAPKPPPSLLDDLMANTPTWVLAGGALVLLGGIVALLAARRHRTTRFDEGTIADSDIKTNTVFGSTGGGVVNTGDNSLSNEFSREGLGSIDTDEVDPIAEAEVYLAYGRDAQAEEILKHALRKDPQRQEIYLKLLEIHAQHNKPSAFDTVAAELYSVSKGQGETWQKAVALGRQLDPANPMFAGADVGGDAVAEAGAAPGGGAAGGEAASARAGAVETPPPRLDTTFDARLDEELAFGTSGTPSKSPADILAGAQSELEKTARGAATGGIGALAAGEESAAEHVEPAIDKTRDDMSLDFHLDEPVEPALLRQTEAAERSERPQPAIELDKLDLAFDAGGPETTDSTPSVLDGQWHDAATKLDLAKAYQEMGDVEGAREILQEVLREGDDAQKAEAQGLIDKLA